MYSPQCRDKASLWSLCVGDHCVCSPRDWLSLALGLASIALWCTAEVPQVVANLAEPVAADDISLAFVLMWAVGDLFNLVGCCISPVALPTQLLLSLLYSVTTTLLLVRRCLALCLSTPSGRQGPQAAYDDALENGAYERGPLYPFTHEYPDQVDPSGKEEGWNAAGAHTPPQIVSPGSSYTAPAVAIPLPPRVARLSPHSVSGSWRAVTLASSFGVGSFAPPPPPGAANLSPYAGATPATLNPAQQADGLAVGAGGSTPGGSRRFGGRQGTSTRLNALCVGLLLIGCRNLQSDISTWGNALSLFPLVVWPHTPARTNPGSTGTAQVPVEGKGAVENGPTSPERGRNRVLLASDGQGLDALEASLRMPSPKPWASTARPLARAASGGGEDQGVALAGAAQGGKPGQRRDNAENRAVESVVQGGANGVKGVNMPMHRLRAGLAKLESSDSTADPLLQDPSTGAQGRRADVEGMARADTSDASSGTAHQALVLDHRDYALSNTNHYSPARAGAGFKGNWHLQQNQDVPARAGAESKGLGGLAAEGAGLDAERVGGVESAEAPAPSADVEGLEDAVADILGWGMACIYLTGRLPQLVLNYARGTVDMLSLPLFFSSLLGNVFYLASILAHGLAWDLIWPNLPWLVDSALCMLMDILIFAQYSYFCWRAKQQEELGFLAELEQE